MNPNEPNENPLLFPWKWDSHCDKIRDNNGDEVCAIEWEATATAIIKAVQSHAALVEALTRCRNEFEAILKFGPPCQADILRTITAAETALNAATK
jgi:hypothetical protein